jgi:TatD DNase family protein
VTDAHAHLDFGEEPASALVERARAAGVTRIVTIGTGIESCRAALAIAEENDGVHAALGVDPHKAAEPDAHRVDELRELLAHPKAVAVGETGLDNARRYATPDEQRRLFDAQLALADELGLPVVVHTRDADADTAAALAGFAGTVVMHCFSSPGLLAPAAVPADRILVETDTPYLAPQPVRGRRNEPAHVVHTIAALAAVRGEEPEATAAATHANAAAAFGLA